MIIEKKITITCSKKEMNIVANFIDLLENIDEDSYEDVTAILGSDIYDRVSEFYRLMQAD
jgi:hypothetical protein